MPDITNNTNLLEACRILLDAKVSVRGAKVTRKQTLNLKRLGKSRGISKLVTSLTDSMAGPTSLDGPEDPKCLIEYVAEMKQKGIPGEEALYFSFDRLNKKP